MKLFHRQLMSNMHLLFIARPCDPNILTLDQIALTVTDPPLANSTLWVDPPLTLTFESMVQFLNSFMIQIILFW